MRGRGRKFIGGLAFLTTILCRPVRAGEVADLVSRHTATRDAVQALSCEFRIDTLRPSVIVGDVGRTGTGRPGNPDRQQLTGTYIRYGDQVRLKVRSPDGTSDCVRDALTSTCLMTTAAGGGSAHSAVVRPANRKRVLTRGDIWAEAMIDLSLPNTIEYVPLADLVAGAKRTRRGSGPDQLALTFPCNPEVCSNEWTVTVDLSPDHGHLVRKCVYATTLTDGRRQVRTDEVVEFTRTPTGHPFPARIKYEARIADDVVWASDVAIAAVKTPASFPSDTFRLRFRDRTPMTDHLRMTTYDVDAAGNRISPEKPLSDAAPGTDSAGNPLPPTEDTEVEPARRLHWYVLGGSAALLLGVVGYRWKWRASRDA